MREAWHRSSRRAGLQEKSFSATLVRMPLPLIVGIAAVPAMVRAIVPVVVGSRMRSVMLAVVQTMVGIPVQPAMPASVRA